MSTDQNSDPFESLVSEWRDEADQLQRRGLQQPAALLRSCADDLETAREEYRTERLTLDEAAAISHLTYSTLQQKVGDEIPNAGKKGSPRIERQDVPKRSPMRHPLSLNGDVEEQAETLATDSLAAQA